jgi:hypothetical protein
MSPYGILEHPGTPKHIQNHKKRNKKPLMKSVIFRFAGILGPQAPVFNLLNPFESPWNPN